MKDDSLSMGTAFAHWQHLTDAYALEVRALQRGEPGAAAKLMRIAGELHRSRRSAGGHDDVFPPQAAPDGTTARIAERPGALGRCWRALRDAVAPSGGDRRDPGMWLT